MIIVEKQALKFLPRRPYPLEGENLLQYHLRQARQRAYTAKLRAARALEEARMTRPEQSKGGLIRGTPEWDAEIRDIVDTCERDSSHEHWIVEPLAGMFWPAVQADIEAERRRRRSAINQRGHGMSETFVRYQCSENPKHRGWREADEPRGTCEFCLAVTRWEQEAVGGRREAAPSHLLPEVRFPHLYAPVPEDSA